ncbi:hypothetical protein [Halalkalibacter urbisdiaboli]|uniref:hypothetical protein n=1 Tax=Halalkalibacter urbisdiaboli TaxID=1960589 RepID=UPI000B42CF9B|nr:hypothetical protein [Halalkalibacter urbisdiaboli]
MEADWVYVASISVAVIFLFVAAFQVLLSLGYPLGEAAMGGYYKVLPKRLRLVSAGNAIILLFMGFLFLQHANVISVGFTFFPTHILVWVFTIFLGINTIANLLSKSEKERYMMTPLSSIAFILCFFVAIS